MSIRLERVTTGQKLTAEMINDPNDAIKRSQIYVGPDSGIGIIRTDKGINLYIDNDRLEIWAKITGHSNPAGAAMGSGPYAWTQQIAAIDGTWADGNRSSDLMISPAYEQNANMSVAVGTIVRISFQQSARIWTFEASLCP